ncbi:MAG: 8-amino-7-oxononanoate synthase [Myxococcota bacterium]|nr:8-amino-7-oxononanoate synthase [Myxococcota bacterium]
MLRDNAPTERFVQELQSGLNQREAAGLLRSLVSPEGVDLTSNDCLGYSQAPDLKSAVQQAVERFGSGSGASRLLRGNHPFLQEAEQELASFSQREAALLFSSGFAANVGLFKALTSSDDLLLSDELNHASIIDGMRLAPAKRAVFRHQDLSHLETLLREQTFHRAFIVTESLFSMDGDLTDLVALCHLAKRYEAMVIVDEAHATGVFGTRGSGLVEALGLEQEVLCTLHTGGKALGVGGAWIAGDAPLIRHLVNHARSFVYSTAPIRALACGLQAAVRTRRAEAAPAKALLERARWFRGQLKERGFEILRSESHIIPVVLGDNERALQIASALQADGFDVRAVRPPTVAEGSARLRITLRTSLNLTTLERFLERLSVHHQGMTP